MKRLFSLFALLLAVGLGTMALDAQAAKRMGSGKSLGMQRQASPDKAPAATAAPTAAAAAPAAAAASPMRSWMGPLAGIAAGLGIAALASHFGFGDALASMVMMGLLAAAVVGVIGWLMRRRASAPGAAPSAPGMRYAPVYAGVPQRPAQALDDAPRYKVAMPPAATGLIGSDLTAAAGGASGRIPADFDSAGFVRNARVQFIRLQAAYDAGDLADIQGFTTPALFAELQRDLVARGAVAQHSEVQQLQAEVVEVAEDADDYRVSVRYTGVMRDTREGSEEAFDEVWHLVKPRQGTAGWVLAGIEQMA